MEIIIILAFLYLGFCNRPDKNEKKRAKKARKKKGFFGTILEDRANYWKKRDRYMNGGGWWDDVNSGRPPVGP